MVVVYVLLWYRLFMSCIWYVYGLGCLGCVCEGTVQYM